MPSLFLVSFTCCFLSPQLPFTFSFWLINYPISSFNAHFTALERFRCTSYILVYTYMFDFISVWVKVKPPHVTAFSCSILYLTKNRHVRAKNAQTAWEMTNGEAFSGSSRTERTTSTDQEKNLPRSSWKYVINLVLLVSSELLCLHSFHGDRGAPWWLINTQGAIHLHRLWERQSSWYLSPHSQPQMQM